MELSDFLPTLWKFLLIIPIAMVAGNQQNAKKFAQDAARILQHAWLGQRHIPDLVSPGDFTPLQLCQAMDASSYAAIQRCMVIDRHHITCTLASSRGGFTRCTAVLHVSLDFSGKTAEGEPIFIRYEKQPIEVTVQQQKGWRLTQITKKGTDSN